MDNIPLEAGNIFFVLIFYTVYLHQILQFEEPNIRNITKVKTINSL